MREETHASGQLICAVCKQPITEDQRPYKGLDSGEKAHLACYIDRMDEEEINLGR